MASSKSMKDTKSSRPQPKNELEFLLQELDFEELDIINAAMIQPKLFARAAQYRVLKMREASAAKGTFENVKAEVATDAREEAAGRGEKITERNMDEILNTSKKVVRAKEALVLAEQDEEAGKLMVEAYRHRRDACRIVADMIRGEELSVRDGQSMSNDLQKKLSKRFPKGS